MQRCVGKRFPFIFSGAQDSKKANLNAGDSNVHRIKDILSDYIAAKCLPISGANFSGDCRGFRHALLRDLREMDVQQLYFHLGSNDILTNEAVFYRSVQTPRLSFAKCFLGVQITYKVVGYQKDV
ncbi:hypothetical protein DPMN_160882 [Dreissena polymorpha]|uniref:Uncharacterized protein n=1 Tax=Dreissena polymorpha TaxID=45954 RepID=A0A9D4ES34_DREPO|nr:hypothetical protein DPMN_160882 [Dreissena polymorpha]